MSGGPLLDARLVVERDGFRLDLPIGADAGEVVALLGPNGAGKSTALRALAGLAPLHGGDVRVAGECWDDPAAGLFVPPERRAASLVFQDYRLFPHLTVLENVAFGLRCRGVRRSPARAEAAGWLARLGLSGYADRRPGQLSGGQAQRVALARALAVRPALLLLDEPLAALDARTRLDIRAELHQHLRAHPGATLLVTHDLVDAMALADRVLVVEEGRPTQCGTPATVAARPRTGYVARLAGLNLLRAVADSGRVRFPGGAVVPVDDGLRGDVFVAFPPAAVRLAPPMDGGPAGERPSSPLPPEACWPATVAGVERYGDQLRVRLDGPVPVFADVPPARVGDLDLRVGGTLFAGVLAADVSAYPVDGEPVRPAPDEQEPLAAGGNDGRGSAGR